VFHEALTAKRTARPGGTWVTFLWPVQRGIRAAVRFLEMQPHNSAIGKYTKKTIQMTSSTNMTAITIGGHTRWNRLSRGIVAGLSMAVGPRWRPATESNLFLLRCNNIDRTAQF